MQYTKGSVIRFTPDDSGWHAVLKAPDDKEHAVPIIGWVIVVTDAFEGFTSTEVKPVMMADSIDLVTVEQFVDEYHDGTHLLRIERVPS
jgi:hypothetical protein